MPFRALILSLLLLPCFSGSPLAQKGSPSKPETGEAALTPVVIDWLMDSAYAPDNEVRDGVSINLGGNQFKFSLNKQSGEFALNFSGKNLVVPKAGKVLEAPCGGRVAHIACFPDAAGSMRYFPADAMMAEVGGLKLLFIDGNFNGKYFDEGVDFVALAPRGAFAFMFRKELPLVDYAYTFTPGRGKEAALAYSRTEFSTKGEARKLQNLLNSWRMQFGLNPCQSDPAWDKACTDHCEYMKQNNVMAHSQDPKKPGHSKEGAEAARTSILSKTSSASLALGGWFNQPLHGRAIRAPWLFKAAFGANDSYVCLRVDGFAQPDFALRKVAVFPPNGAIDVPLSGADRESPEPRLDATKPAGYPITFSYPWAKSFVPREFKATLEMLEGGKWLPVETQATAPGVNAPATLKGMKYTYMFSTSALKAATTYRITAKFSTEDREEVSVCSCFTTGSRNEGRGWEPNQQR